MKIEMATDENANKNSPMGRNIGEYCWEKISEIEFQTFWSWE